MIRMDQFCRIRSAITHHNYIPFCFTVSKSGSLTKKYTEHKMYVWFLSTNFAGNIPSLGKYFVSYAPGALKNARTFS
jgi:hypothetical protein